MIAYPAIDLRGGRVVQLVGGRPEEERVSLPDPEGVARGWVSAGFRAIHVVDLDAALGEGSNRDAVIGIIESVAVPVHVGGGIRDEELVAELLEAGAARVVIGTRAVEERSWAAALADRHPGRIVVAADVRGERVVTRGWTAETELDAATLIRELERWPLGGILVTDVGREGRMEGADALRFGALVAATDHPIIASGGISTTADLRALEAAGCAGAVLGMALYTGALDAPAVARDFPA